VWILDSEIIAEEIHDLAARYGHSNLYAAMKVEARNTCYTPEKLPEVIVA